MSQQRVTRSIRKDGKDWNCPMCGKHVVWRLRTVSDDKDGRRKAAGEYFTCPDDCELDGQRYYVSPGNETVRIIMGSDGNPINP